VKRILISGIGGDIAQGVATILREARPEIKLLGIDVHDQHGGHLFVDHFLLIPNASSFNYLSSLKKIIKEHKVDAVILMSEPELNAALPLLELESDVKWITSGAAVVKAGLDKFKTMQALIKVGIPIPWTILVCDGHPISYPCILKNRAGSGSRAVFIVKNDEDADYLAKQYPDAIFQELLEPNDREVTCAVYRRKDGRVSTLLMLRRLTGGFTGWAKVIKDDAATRMCETIAKGLNLQGSMNVQIRLTEEGPRVFEINPRFSSTVLMRHRLGFSDVLWAIDEAEGKLINFPEIPEDQMMVRVQSATIYS
jgi:carbamoyl-phosphate synthase large subunit